MTTESDDNEVPEKRGYKHPPKECKWQKGRSGNPKGRPRKQPTPTLLEAIRQELDSPRKDSEGRASINAKQVLIREHVLKAAKGEVRALKELVKLLEDNPPAPPQNHVMVLNYSEAIAAQDILDLDEDFFVEEDKKIRKWIKEEENKPPSMREMIERELGRKTLVQINGKPVKLSMAQIIAKRFVDLARSDGSIYRLLMKLGGSEKPAAPKFTFFVARPTEDELRFLHSFRNRYPNDPKVQNMKIPRARKSGHRPPPTDIPKSDEDADVPPNRAVYPGEPDPYA